MQLFKSFIAGIVVPTIIVPIGIFVFTYFGKEEVLKHPFPHLIPIAWGFWNMFYIGWLRDKLQGSETVRIFIAGALLGLIVASVGVFVLNIPAIVGLPESIVYLPLLVGPVLYGALFVLFLKPLNRLLGVS